MKSHLGIHHIATSTTGESVIVEIHTFSTSNDIFWTGVNTIHHQRSKRPLLVPTKDQSTGPTPLSRTSTILHPLTINQLPSYKLSSICIQTTNNIIRIPFVINSCLEYKLNLVGVVCTVHFPLVQCFTDTSFDGSIGRVSNVHSRPVTLGIQRIGTKVLDLFVVSVRIHIRIRSQWISTVHLDFVKVIQSVTVRIGIIRIRSILFPLFKVCKSIGITVWIQGVCSVLLDFIKVIQSITVSVGIVGIGVVNDGFFHVSEAFVIGIETSVVGKGSGVCVVGGDSFIGGGGGGGGIGRGGCVGGAVLGTLATNRRSTLGTLRTALLDTLARFTLNSRISFFFEQTSIVLTTEVRGAGSGHTAATATVVRHGH
mmetsp:Transcript_12427/g.27153  ORF Transcript_12427/g.27153 Transcript_12427/m.27153 type:complete len:369 (-) Transcript_12427:346-1452(-)